MKKYRYIAYVLVVLIAFWLGMLVERGALDPDSPNIHYETSVLFSAEMNEYVYMKHKTWGNNQDKVLSVISTSATNKFSPNKDTDYIFENTSEFIYKLVGTTLTIYTELAPSTPDLFSSKFNVNVVVLKAQDYNLMKNNLGDTYRLFD